MFSFSTFIFQGFGLAISLIVAIGAQNAFVLERSLSRNRIWLVAGLCIFFDIVFFVLGAYAVSTAERFLPGMQNSVAFASGIFLLGYSIRSLYYVGKDRMLEAGVKPHQDGRGKIAPRTSSDDPVVEWKDNLAKNPHNSHSGNSGWVSTVLLTSAVTLLNPHFYLDTFFLLGSRASLLNGGERVAFLLGAFVASGFWFSSLALLGKFAARLFKVPLTWKVLDALIAILMGYWSYVLLDPFIKSYF